MALTGRACLILALALCVAGIGASLYGARRGRPAWVDRGRRAVYALAAMLTVAFAILEVAFLRSDFSFAVVAGPLEHDHADVLQGDRDVVLAGGLAAALGLAAVAVVGARAAPDARRRCATSRRTRRRSLLGFAAFFTMLCVFFVQPVRDAARRRAGGGRGAQPAAAPPER